MKYIITLFQNLERNEAYAFGRCVKFDTSTRFCCIIFAWMQKKQQRIVNVKTEFPLIHIESWCVTKWNKHKLIKMYFLPKIGKWLIVENKMQTRKWNE